MHIYIFTDDLVLLSFKNTPKMVTYDIYFANQYNQYPTLNHWSDYWCKTNAEHSVP